MTSEQEWAGPMGRLWAELNTSTDRQLSEVADIAVAALAPAPGERILDLGCGGGATSLRLADAVGETGRVLGVDISADLLGIARARSAARPWLSFAEGDAAVHPFEPGAFDGLFSRMGCMFFADPAAAFANIRKALRPDARIVLAAFADPADNAWATLPIEAAASVLDPAPPEPGVPGPFAWSDPAIFRAALSAAGFRDITHAAEDVRFALGVGEDPDPVTRAIGAITQIGVVARRLRAHPDPDTARAAVEPLLRSALAAHVEGDWVRLSARFWLIQARA